MPEPQSPKKEKLLRRLQEETSLLGRRLESINRRIEMVPNLDRKILILKEERNRTMKQLKKELKRNSLELSSFKGFVEGLDSKDQKAESRKKVLLSNLDDLLLSYQKKREIVFGFDEELPPDIEV